jgi:DNA replication and repair protein RecF
MLRRLVLENFRCHAGLDWEVPPGHVLLWGPNGRGKTAVLEAIHLLGRARSFRSRHPREWLRQGAERGGAAGWVGAAEDPVKWEWEEGRRVLSMGGVRDVPLESFWGRLPVVVFHNGERELVTGPSMARRQWLDALAAQCEGAHLPLVLRVQRLHRERLALLRQPQPGRAVWQSLTAQIREHLPLLVERRRRWAEALGPRVEESYRVLAGGSEELRVHYTEGISERLAMADGELWRVERERGAPWIGPHGDEWEVVLQGRSLRRHGSEGQQKSGLLALKLAELALVRSAGAGEPLVLLDDVLQELDGQRRERFWGLVRGAGRLFYTHTGCEPAGGVEWTSCEVQPGRVY